MTKQFSCPRCRCRIEIEVDPEDLELGFLVICPAPKCGAGIKDFLTPVDRKALAKAETKYFLKSTLPTILLIAFLFAVRFARK